jgi:hypothetical protein
MTRLLTIAFAIWLISGAPGWLWVARIGCEAPPVVVTDAPYAFSTCEFDQAVVTIRGRASYVYLDGVRVFDHRQWLPEVMHGPSITGD